MDSKELYPKETITERPRFGDEGTYAPEDSKQPPRFEDQGTCILEESKQLLGYFTVFTSVPISKVDKTKGYKQRYMRVSILSLLSGDYVASGLDRIDFVLLCREGMLFRSLPINSGMERS